MVTKMKTALLLSLFLISPTGLMASPLTGTDSSVILVQGVSVSGRNRSTLNMENRTQAHHKPVDGALRNDLRQNRDLAGLGDPCRSPTKMLRNACVKDAYPSADPLVGDSSGTATGTSKETLGGAKKPNKKPGIAGLAPYKGCVKPVKTPSGPQRFKDCVDVKPLTGRG